MLLIVTVSSKRPARLGERPDSLLAMSVAGRCHFGAQVLSHIQN